jgi:3-methyladenine DNA glycosylase Tag
MERCAWAGNDNQLYIAYHDTEWGEERGHVAPQEVVDSFDFIRETVIQPEQRL